MSKTIILRFRDLVTEEGGTIREHKALLYEFGEVWWGWWMRQYEKPPYPLFKELSGIIKERGKLDGYLFNTGNSKLYITQISKILTPPPGHQIDTPEPEKSPSYYHRGRYPAWFLLKSLEEVEFDSIRLKYESFPTRIKLSDTLSNLLGAKVMSPVELRQTDVTLWVVNVEK